MAIGPITLGPVPTAPVTAPTEVTHNGSVGQSAPPESGGEAAPSQTTQPTQPTEGPARTTQDTTPVRASPETLLMANAVLEADADMLRLSAIIDPKTDPAFLTEDVAREMALKLQKSIEDSMILTSILTSQKIQSSEVYPIRTDQAEATTQSASLGLYDAGSGEKRE